MEGWGRVQGERKGDEKKGGSACGVCLRVCV